MSLVGDKLKSIIQENNINIYQLAKRAGIERTTIHKVINSNRIPSREYFNRLMDSMPLTANERSELIHCFEISTIGEFRYMQRRQVKNLIEHVSELASFLLPRELQVETARGAQSPAEEYLAVYGEFAVNNLLEGIVNEAFMHQDPMINFFMPADYTFFFDSLFMRYAKNCVVNIKCILEFQKTTGKTERRNANLDALHTLLPFLALPREGFDAYYVYSAHPVQSISILAMPFFVITNNAVLTLSPDLRTAIAQRNQIVASGYMHSFRNILSQTRPLMTRYTIFDILSHYRDTYMNNKATVKSSIEPHPCVGSNVTAEFIESHLKEDVPDREALVNSTTQYFQTLASVDEKKISLFTKEGFESFQDQGLIPYLPMRYSRGFSEMERAEMIRRLLRDIDEGRTEARLINQAKFRVPTFATLTVAGETGLNVTIGSPDNSNIIYIDEISIVDAFDDFMQNILVTDLVYTKEETLAVLENALEKLTIVSKDEALHSE